jgi:hypothetical protein
MNYIILVTSIVCSLHRSEGFGGATAETREVDCIFLLTSTHLTRTQHLTMEFAVCRARPAFFFFFPFLILVLSKFINLIFTPSIRFGFRDTHLQFLVIWVVS